MKRHRDVNDELENLGWTVLRFWGKDIKNDVKLCADKIIEVLGDKI